MNSRNLRAGRLTGGRRMDRFATSLDYLRDSDPSSGTQSTTRNRNVIRRAAPAPFIFGWLGPVATMLAQGKAFAMSLNPNNPLIMVTSNGPTQSLYNTADELVAAMRIAAQGAAVKALGQALMPAAGADLTLAATPANTRSFGLRVDISNPPQSFPFGRVFITLRDGVTDLYQVAVTVNVLPCTVVLLGAQGAGGAASVVGIANPQVVVTGSANATQPSAVVSSATFVATETLNIRDLGSPEFV